MNRTVLAVALIALLAVLPGAAPAQKKKQPGNLTLAASAPTVKFGRTVTLSGKLTGPQSAGKTVALREDPFPFGALDNADSTTTNAQGDYSFTRTPTVNTLYQTRQGGNESDVVTVQVSPAIRLRVGDRTPRAGRRLRFSGRVCPEHDGASLELQRRVARKSWRTVRRARLRDIAGSPCSRYARRVRVRRDGAYRAFLAADADHAAGSSRLRRIDVH